MLEEKAFELLEDLAVKIGVASEKIWEWSLLQVKVDIATSIGFLFLTVLLCVGYAYLIKHVHKNWEELYRNDWEVLVGTGMGLLAIILVFMIAGSLFDLYKLPQLIINPEYSAFQKIISELSKLR